LETSGTGESKGKSDKIPDVQMLLIKPGQARLRSESTNLGALPTVPIY
jgi:hypothetical protein